MIFFAQSINSLRRKIKTYCRIKLWNPWAQRPWSRCATWATVKSGTGQITIFVVIGLHLVKTAVWVSRNISNFFFTPFCAPGLLRQGQLPPLLPRYATASGLRPSVAQMWNVFCFSYSVFLPRDAMLARYLPSSCIRLSFCPSVTSRVLLRRLNLGLRKQRHTISQRRLPKISAKTQKGHTQ